MKFKYLIPFFLALVPAIARAEPQNIAIWRGLHNADAAVLINDNESQSLSNMDITDGGKSIKKRSGYSLFQSVGSSTYGIRGGYYFRDVSGNDNVVHSNMSSIYKSVNSAAFSAFITTETAGSYQDFTDSRGYLWRANNNRDEIARYDGTTTVYYPSLPKGNQVEALSDRLVISGTSANPNTINFSESGDFTNFTTGIEETDPFTETVSLPGQAVTAIKSACGGILAWTKDTTSLVTAQNQYDLNPTIPIAEHIGTKQPGSVLVDLGVTFWLAQDNHFYSYDCNTIKKISQVLDTSGFASGESKQSSITSAADFASGTLTNTSTSTVVGSLVLSVTDGNIDNNSFETTGGCSGLDALNWTSLCGGVWSRNDFSGSGHPSQSGSYAAWYSGGTTYNLKILDAAGTTLTSVSYLGVDAVWTARTLSLASYIGKYIYIKLDGGSDYFTSDVFLCSGGTLSWYDTAWNSLGASAVDNFTLGKSTITTGTFKSASINLGSSATSWGQFEATFSNGNGAVTFAIYTDTDTTTTISDSGSFISSQTITNGSIPSVTIKPYLVVTSTLTSTDSTSISGFAQLDDITINYNQGSVVPVFGAIDKNHRLMWSVAEGTSTSNSATYIYDQRFDSWLKYSFPMDAPARVGDVVYFGNVSSGTVYTWPSGETDNTSAITAYWQSKDFISGNPHTEKDFKTYSLVCKAESGSNLDITYTINTSSAVANNFSLTDSNSNTIRRINANMPSGKFGTFISWKFGNDDASAPFELYSFSYEFVPRPWRVLP